MIEFADEDGSGKINLEEFIEVVQDHAGDDTEEELPKMTQR